MAESLINSGYEVTMDIVKAYSPRYWKKIDYGNHLYILRYVGHDSCEFSEIEQDIVQAQDYYGVEEFDDIHEICRVQNPYSYAQFVLRKRDLKAQHGYIYQYRKFKIINMDMVNVALKYNCDGRRLGKDDNDYRFFPSLPNIYEGNAVIVLQVLSDDLGDRDEIVECERDNDFYIEYVVYFEHH